MAITSNCLMFDNQQLLYDGTGILYNEDPLNPLNLPPYTIRLLYRDGVTPSFSKGTGVQVSQSPNIWDLTYTNTDWGRLVYWHVDLLKVLGGNTSNVRDMTLIFGRCTSLNEVNIFDTSKVTNMTGMFNLCGAITTVPLFNTYSVEAMASMFYACTHLTTVPLFNTANVRTMRAMFSDCGLLSYIPLFNTSNVTDVRGAFTFCYKVETGALALYNQLSSQSKPPTQYSQAFWDCGKDTVTGAAELAQIPSDWK